ncbi:hypothetical protein V1478_009369 [Vespula squamosa]|uniref:Uncharacterized protein n=1 Tax=Vespula squamosa TaxID=30214 RepID=A0ABD2APF4_VESSQ
MSRTKGPNRHELLVVIIHHIGQYDNIHQFIWTSTHSIAVITLINDSSIHRVNDSTIQRVNDSTIQRFIESTIQRVIESTIQRVIESSSQRFNNNFNQLHDIIRPTSRGTSVLEPSQNFLSGRDRIFC